MTTFVNNDVSPGATILASHHNTQGALIAAAINGGIDNANIATGAAIATSKLADDAGITYAKVATGFAVQQASTNFSAVATGTTLLPYDDTIPQNTEGVEFMTQAITPKSTTNILVIEATLMLASSVANNISVALFQDSTANALAAQHQTTSVGDGAACIKLTHRMAAGTTSSTTFKIRAGGSLAGTTTFNGSGGNRKFGGITVSNITITEYKAT